jgi:O-acetylhomoserine/O-acetylserine sulfhydrylase
MNPTSDVFEQRMAALEGGIAAMATSSGQAAQFIAISTICNAGDSIVASSHLYGGTYNQWKVFLKKFSITCKFVNSDKAADFEGAIDETTKAIYIESIANPAFSVPDIPAFAELARSRKIPLIVDNVRRSRPL